VEENKAWEYRNAGRLLLGQAKEELDKGDVRQASEKGWGAAAQIVKAIAEQRGWQHNTHGRLHQIAGSLVRETGDRDIFNLFGIASSLHTNFYENWAIHAEVDAWIQGVEQLLDKLEPLLESTAPDQGTE
jgi:hypothetical protein